MSGIFDPAGARVFSISAGANFLGSLARVLVRDLDLTANPEALADALIYVPNRRSERALAFAIHQAANGNACLLPMIRALGDLETNDPPPSAEAALANLPPVISPAQRIGSLTRLVMAYSEANSAGMPAVSCLSAARELARLLDQAALSGEVDWGSIKDLVLQAELAEHWQQSVEFLKIITDQWPARLDDLRMMDPYARRYAAAQAMVAEWRKTPPHHPVIIAGSTGATPASRLLMEAALELPNGLVVLPGLDLELDIPTLERVADTPSHPQFTLARALTHLDLTPADVAPWPNSQEGAQNSARRRLVHEALAPAQSTADWTTKLANISDTGIAGDFVEQALVDLTVLEAADDSEEALIAAILMRETLERPGETAALVTPDAGLARRVSAMLERWQIQVAPSAGLPLSQTGSGSLALLVADWMLDLSHPVALIAVLQHASARFDAAAIQALDKHFLRGPRVWQDWPGLVEHVDALGQGVADRYSTHSDNDYRLARGLLLDLSDLLQGLELEVEAEVSGETWYGSVADLSTSICTRPHPWAGEQGATLSRLFQDMAELSVPLGDQRPKVWTDLFAAEAQAQTVAAGEVHPRLAIWGPLEARLQTADRIILAGLNEGVWPEQPPADAFLPRVFRKQIGLTDPDERIGLSAHDFAQFASAPNVTLLTSRRRDDKPAIASRWLWRLRTLARGALGDWAETAFAPKPGANPLDWLKDLESAPSAEPDFSAEPRPKPPVSARPKALSVTRIEQLVRDPYAIYCESVLGLRPLDPLNLPPDVRVRGTAIHKALERFEDEAVSNDAEALLDLLEQELKRGGVAQADLIALRDQRRRVCAAYLDWRNLQSHILEGRAITELRGTLKVPIGSEVFTLSGTADRIERRIGDTLAVLDFKTGKPPSEKQVRAGLSPQMPLQGLIAQRGGYEKLGAKPVEALTYLRFGTQFDVQEIGAGSSRAKLDEKPVNEIIADAEAGLIRLLTAFANPDHPYLSAPRPERVSYESAYARLARRDEWTGLGTYD